MGNAEFWYPEGQEKEKTGENPGEIKNLRLTNGDGCDMMVIHSVIICPFVPIFICEIILPQNMADVKREVSKK